MDGLVGSTTEAPVKVPSVEGWADPLSGNRVGENSWWVVAASWSYYYYQYARRLHKM